MTKRTAAISAAFLLLAFALFAPVVKGSSVYNQIMGAWLYNSKVDATPIGQTSAAAINGTKIMANESSTTSGGGYSFVQDGGFDTGMFSPADGVLSLYSNGTVGLQLNANGITVNGAGNNSVALTAKTFNGGTLLGGFSSALSAQQSDVDLHLGESTDGNNWGILQATHNNGTAAYSLKIQPFGGATTFGSGTVTIPNLSATLTGNASTSSALASTPSQCVAGQYATGIAANGNAQCSGFPAFNGTSGYQQLMGGLFIAWGTGSSVASDSVQAVSLPVTFPHACLSAWTVNLDPSQSTNITKNWAVVSCSGNSVTVELQRRGDEGSFSAQPRVFAFGY